MLSGSAKWGFIRIAAITHIKDLELNLELPLNLKGGLSRDAG